MSEEKKDILGVDHDECGELLDEALEGQEFALGELLRQDARQELERREGDWDAFSAQLALRLDREATALEHKSLEDRAIAAFRAQVEAEVSGLAPSFEGAFRHGVEQRIWQAAKEQPSLYARVKGAVSHFLEGERARWSLATAGLAVAAASAVFFSVQPVSGPDPVAAAEEVSLDRLSFEGTATVMSEGSVTVLWLTDAEES